MTTSVPQARRHYDAAVQYEIAGDLPSAVVEMKKAVDLDPTFYDAWLKLGVYYSEVDRLEEAEEALDGAKKVDPSQGHAYFEKAVVLLKQERFEEALAELDQISPDGPHAIQAEEQKRAIRSKILNQKGRELGDQKRWGEAIEAFRESLAHLPGNVDSWMGLALALYGAHRINEALAEVRKVLDKEPDYVRALYLCADLLMELVEESPHYLPEARACYQSALKLAEDRSLKQELRLKLAQAESLPRSPGGLTPTRSSMGVDHAGLGTYVQIGWLVSLAVSFVWYIPQILVVQFATDRSLDFVGDAQILALGTVISGAIIGFMAYANDVQGKVGPTFPSICRTLGMLVTPVWSFVLSLLLAWHYGSWLVAGAGVGLTLLFSLRFGAAVGQAIGWHMQPPEVKMSLKLDSLADELEREYLASRYDEVTRRGQEVLKGSATDADQLALTRIARTVGRAYTVLSKYDNSWKALEVALAAARKSRETEQICLALIDLAYVEVQLGQDEAREHYRQAVRLARNAGSNSLQGRAFYGLANFHALRGEYTRSLGFLNYASEAMRRAIQDADKLVKAFEIRAMAYEAQGLTTQAAQFRERADEFRHQYAEDWQAWMDIMIRYGDLLLNDGADADAERAYHEVLQTPSQTGGIVQRGRACEGLGNVALFRGKIEQRAAANALFDQAEKYYGQAAVYFEQVGGSDLIWSPHTLLGDLYHKWLDQTEEAFEAYKTARDSLEVTRRSLPWDDRARIGFAERRTAPYTGLVALLCLLPEEKVARLQIVSRWAFAFEVVEQARSRALIDLLGSQIGARLQPINMTEARQLLDA